MGFAVSSYPVAVQAHLIITIVQPPKITEHSAQSQLSGEPRSGAAYHHRVVGHKPHKVINVTCSPRPQKRSRNYDGISLSCVLRRRCRETAEGNNRAHPGDAVSHRASPRRAGREGRWDEAADPRLDVVAYSALQRAHALTGATRRGPAREYVGIDLHKKEGQICLLTETGEVMERRIRTEPPRFAEVLGGRATRPDPRRGLDRKRMG